jgi:hypothetical protein
VAAIHIAIGHLDFSLIDLAPAAFYGCPFLP